MRFDYSFISKALNECGFGILLNRRICTIEFAQCCIESPKYKLEVLKEFLGVENMHHRALDDAWQLLKFLNIALENFLII